MNRIERIALIIWAGVFLALFYLNKYNRKAPPYVPWDEWKVAKEEVGHPVMRKPSWENSPSPKKEQKFKKLPKAFNGQIRTDTVSEHWLMSWGDWPAWKARRFIELRAKYQGVDTLIIAKEGWDAVPWEWLPIPPERQNLESVDVSFLYSHPLWRAPQVRAFNQFRTRVRPLRKWEELFQLAEFDSAQKALLPIYFQLGGQ